MKTFIAAALCVAGMMGTAFAEDAMAPANDAMSAPMATPMSGDMMNTMMTPNDMLASCLKHAGMLADAMAQDAGKKTCNDAMALAMGTPMGGDAMAPMATDGMSADPAAKSAM
jgi:hypothetical protein